MRSQIQAVALPSDPAELTDEFRRLFRDLGWSTGASALAGECTPPADIFETDEAVQIVMDLPGVDPQAVRVVVKGDVVIVAGEKSPRRGRGESSFHLVERGFGRFARLMRLSAACDTARARARLANGELHVTLPKVADRRGQTFQIPITDHPDA
jgi:HSP20 family protein